MVRAHLIGVKSKFVFAKLIILCVPLIKFCKECFACECQFALRSSSNYGTNLDFRMLVTAVVSAVHPLPAYSAATPTISPSTDMTPSSVFSEQAAARFRLAKQRLAAHQPTQNGKCVLSHLGFIPPERK